METRIYITDKEGTELPLESAGNIHLTIPEENKKFLDKLAKVNLANVFSSKHVYDGNGNPIYLVNITPCTKEDLIRQSPDFDL